MSVHARQRLPCAGAMGMNTTERVPLFQGTGLWMRDTRCGIRDTGYEIRDTRYGIRDTGYGIRDTRGEFRDARCEIRVTGYELRDTRYFESQVPDPGSRIPDPASRIAHPESRISQPASHIPHLFPQWARIEVILHFRRVAAGVRRYGNRVAIVIGASEACSAFPRSRRSTRFLS